MSTNPLLQTIDALAKEKGIDPHIVIEAMEEAVVTASRKVFKTNEALKAKFNPEIGQVELFAVKTIVDAVTDPDTEISVAEAREIYGEDAEVEAGYQIEFPRSTEALGRIAAQAAKQVIFQKVREAERENVYAEYHQRVGEVMSGLVKRFEQGDIIVELGRIEAILPRKEQSRAESYAQGDRIRAVIRAVGKGVKGPQIVLSRTDAALLIKLFEQEVPEVFDGLITIKNIVREPGERAKVAVESYDDRIDPVGACVGMKGSRIHGIVRELKNENIDVINYTANIQLLIQRSLTPARITSMELDNESKHANVYLAPDQVSLAIGRRGVNIKLASELTGYELDVYRDNEGDEEEFDIDLEEFSDEIDGWVIDELKRVGCDTARSVLNLTADELERRTDLEKETINELRKVLKTEFEKE